MKDSFFSQGPKVLIIIGVALIFIGFLWHFLAKYSLLGRLPGDIFIKKENMSFYFPIASSILVSILLTLILNLLNKK